MLNNFLKFKRDLSNKKIIKIGSQMWEQSRYIPTQNRQIENLFLFEIGERCGF